MARDIEVEIGKLGGRRISRKLSTVLRHAVLTGTPGWGKSAQVLSLWLSIRRACPSVVFVVLDPKPDIVPTLRDELNPALQGTDLGIHPSRAIVVDSFGPYGVGLNPLAKMAGVEVEAQAHIVTTIIASLAMDGLGQRGTAILAWLARALIPIGGATLADAIRVLGEDRYRLAVAGRVANPEVQRYLRDGFTKEPSASISSLKTRLEWCLLLPALRSALCADHAVDGQKLLAGPLTLISTGNAPAGFSSASRMISGLLFAILTAAIFARKVDDDTPLVVLVVDEAHEVLKASGILADYERVLTMARAKKVALWTITQCLAQLQQSALIESIKANISLHYAFRPEPGELRHLLPLIGVTGRKVDSRRPDRVLSISEEREQVISELGRLPPRHFALADYVGGTLEIAKSLTVPLGPAKEYVKGMSASERDAYLRGSIGIPAAEMARRAARPVVDVSEDRERGHGGDETTSHRPKRQKLELPP